eukprot:GHUV01016494.1.p1 GENE.GHUV01016494.1~~GHUV01016494.1.p1  ORF type:complete len:411 (+),score=130.66 GHUV01016494.1:486-1718(+)
MSCKWGHRVWRYLVLYVQEQLLQQVAASGWFSEHPTTTRDPHLYPQHAVATATGIPSSSMRSTAEQHVAERLAAAQQEDIFLHTGSSRCPSAANQVMVFGVNNMPVWLQQLGQQLPLTEYWPSELATRQPLFDTAIINLYQPGDGITPHVDLLRFSDGIAVVSLGGPAIMNFSLAETAAAAGAAAQAPNVAAAGSCLQPSRRASQLLLDQRECSCSHEAAAEPCSCQQQQQRHTVTNGSGRCCSCCCCSRQQQLLEAAQMDSPLVDSNSSWRQQQLPGPNSCNCTTCQCEQTHTMLSIDRRIEHQLLLQGGDVLLLQGEARYQWQHGIAPVAEELLLCEHCRTGYQGAPAAVYCQQEPLECDTQAADGVHGVRARADAKVYCDFVRVVRGRRVSITLRKLDPRQQVLNMQ